MKFAKVLAALLFPAAVAASAVETSAIPFLPAPGLIDGELTEPSWKKAYVSSDFVPTDPAGSVTENARAYLFCDRENLYIGALMEFADYSAHEKWVSADVKPYGGESVEIFVDPGDTGAYAQFIVTEAGGLVFSSGLCGAVEVASQMHEKDWTLEAKIPYSAIKLPTGSFGKCWRVNVVRNNRQKGESSSWSRLSGGGFHEPAAFNRVEGIPADLSAIRKEQAFAAKGDFKIDTDHLVYTTQDVVRATLDFLHDKSMKGFRAVAALKDESGRTVAEKSVSPVAFHVEFGFDVSGLADGRYDIAVSLLDAEGTTVKSGVSQFWKIPPMPPNPDKWEIRNNCTYLNGEFFFPVTTSLVNWNFACTNREDALAQMGAIFGELAECGFNCAQPVPGNFPDEDTEAYAKCKMPFAWERRTFETTKAAGMTFDDYCRIAAKHGVWLVANSPYLNKTTSLFAKDRLVDHLRRLREKPNIFCWYMSDERDGQPEFNMMLNRFYHDIDPTRPTRINLINAVMQHIGAADIVSTDPYPVPVSRLSKVSSHGDRLVRATEGRPGQARWLVLQMFGNEGCWTRPPTPDEIKCMGMLAVNHGATGLGFFTWTPHRLRNGKRQHPGSMAAVKELVCDLKRFAPALCQGKVVLRGRIDGADVLAVEHEGRKVLSVVNDTDGDLEELEVDVPGFGKTVLSLKKYGYKVQDIHEDIPPAKIPDSRHVFSMSCKVTACNGELATADGRAKAVAWWKKHGITKLWLESYRHGQSVPAELLAAERDAFRADGFEVCGMITPTSLSVPTPKQQSAKFWITCWSDPRARERMREECARAARLFDTVIIDDFLFSACDENCASCAADKAFRGITDWGEYRRELMYEVCERDILPSVKKTNPKAHFIIKYPCWYRDICNSGYDYAQRGYSPVRQAKLFGGCWVGTETRDANPEPLQACWIAAWMDSITGGRCGGGWYDPLDCGPEKFIEQARYTILGGMKESIIHCYDYLLAEDPGVMYESSSRSHDCCRAFEREIGNLAALAEKVRGAERGRFEMLPCGASRHEFRKGGRAFTVYLNTKGAAVQVPGTDISLAPHELRIVE